MVNVRVPVFAIQTEIPTEYGPHHRDSRKQGTPVYGLGNPNTACGIGLFLVVVHRQNGNRNDQRIKVLGLRGHCKDASLHSLLRSNQ